ncbi:MAG TPA: NAD(+)/NADH kinase [Pirellulaceae bacterium]
MSRPPPPPVPWANKSTKPRALVLGSGDRPNLRVEAGRLRSLIEQHLEVVLEDLQYKLDLSQTDADLAVVLGGDGSILRAALQMQEVQVPILGVNLGKLGFLASVSPVDFPRVLPEVVEGECRVVEHLMFRCTVFSDGVKVVETLGLNEVAILTGAPFSILNADLYVDAELATTYACDGLIVSTPVGSTAHSLSAGGPILRKTLPAFVICPVAPHTLTVRPVVDTADRVYEIVVPQPNEGTMVVVDGRPVWRMMPNDQVRIVRAEPTFKMIEARGHSYYHTLREKLGWAGYLVHTDRA